MLRRKFEFLDLCSKSKETGTALNTLCFKTVQKNQDRQATGNILDGILIDCGRLHEPVCMERSIMENVNRFYQRDIIAVAACTPCHQSLCRHAVELHLFIEVTDECDSDPQTFNIISDLAGKIIYKEHNINIVEVFFFQKGTLQPYRK